METQIQQTQKKKPAVNLNLQTDASITQNVVPAMNSLELICNASNMQGIDGIDPNGFDGYGLSLDELNLLYSPTFEISPSEFNLNNGVSLPSATNSLSGGLKPLSEEDDDPKAEDKLMIETVSDGDKKIKRKYNKRTKKSSIFSFDGFDNISQDSPNSSESSAMSPSPTNKNNKDNFLMEANSSAYPPFDPRMMMQYLPSQVFDQNVFNRLPNPGSGFAYTNHNEGSIGTDPSGALPSLLPVGAASQGYYPNTNPNHNHNPNQYPDMFSGQNYAPGMQMMQPMLQDALQGNRYYPGMKSYPLNYGNYSYGGQLPQNPLLNQLTGHPQLPAQYHPNMFVPGGQLTHPGVPMLPNLLGGLNGSNVALPFMPDKNLEVGKGEGDANNSNKSSFQKPGADGLDDFMSLSALELLSIQMENDHHHQQQHLHQQQQQQLLLSQKAQLMQLAAQQMDMTMMMSQTSSAVSAQQTTATSKRRSKITAQPSTKGKAAKGGSSGIIIKEESSINDLDNDEEDIFSSENGNSFIGQVSHHSHNSHGHSGTLNEMVMVTSTSIKSTSRANNSLSTLSRRFVEHYGDSKTIPYISGQLNVSEFTESPVNSCRVDGAAETMNVHVRRIYELIKILEILSLIEFTGGKRGKFSWKGTRDFVYCLGCLQNDAMAKFPSVALSSGLTAVTAAESTEALLPSINKLHINALNAQATAYTADLLLNMKSNSPTNSSTLIITNQLNQSLSHQHSISSIRASVGIAATTVDSDDDDESGVENNSGKAKSGEVFAMLPPTHTGTGAKTLKPKRVVNTASHNGAMEDDDGEGLVAMGKVSFEGGRIDIPSGSDTDIPATMTPVVKLSEDGSSTKKRSKEATPRKICKSKQPDLDQSLQATKQQQAISEATVSPPKADTRIYVNATPQATQSTYSTYAGDHNEHFMMETICRNFLQLFLVGMNGFTMSFAVHTLIPMQENEQPEDYNKKNATKVPRAADLNSTSKKKDQKAELKVMVWGSYSPLVVRQHFLSKSDSVN